MGQTVSLAHLAPFVNISRQKILKEVHDDYCKFSGVYDLSINDEELVKDVAEQRLREEIKRGVQTIQYQIVTLQKTNG